MAKTETLTDRVENLEEDVDSLMGNGDDSQSSDAQDLADDIWDCIVATDEGTMSADEAIDAIADVLNDFDSEAYPVDDADVADAVAS